MNELFLNQVLNPAFFRGYGDLSDEILRVRISFEWTLKGLLSPDRPDARRLFLMNEKEERISFHPGSLVPWEQIPGLWSVHLDDGGRELCTCQTVPVESLRKWFEYLPFITPSHAMEGMDFLLFRSAVREEISVEEMFAVLDYVDGSTNGGSLTRDEAMRWLKRWYPIFERISMRELASGREDSRIIHWLQYNFGLH